jgi:hypothetical protein
MTAFRQLFASCFALTLTAILVGCASIGAPLPPSLELIKPPTDLHAVRKGDQVYLSWTVPTLTMEHQSVRHRGPTLVCRSPQVAMAECGPPAGSVPPEQLPKTSTPKAHEQATFVDRIPPDLIDQRFHDSEKPDDSISSLTYAVEALNTSSRAAGLSNQVQVLLAPTVPPPNDFRAELTSSGVRLSWTAELLSLRPSRVNYVYRIYRRLEGTSERTVIGSVPRGTEQNPSLLDQTFAWEKHYEYWMNVVTEADTGHHACATANGSPASCPEIAEIEGDDSPIVSVFTHDIFPPSVPSGLQAVFSGPGQQSFIDVIWAPDTDADLAGYNVFRHESGGEPVKINADLVKTPSYRDTNIVSGKIYYYSISAVDVRGNESARSEETSEQVP